MTVEFILYAVHIYHAGDYQRTITEPMPQRQAARFCQVYNELHEGLDEEAVAQEVSLCVTPPPRLSVSANPACGPHRPPAGGPSRRRSE